MELGLKRNGLLKKTSGSVAWIKEGRNDTYGPWTRDERVILKHLDRHLGPQRNGVMNVKLGVKRNGLRENIYIAST